MTSLVSNTMSPIKDGTSSLPRRQSSFARPPLRALYDLLIAPMEGVSASRAKRLLGVSTHHLLLSAHMEVFQNVSPLSSFSVSIWKLKEACILGWLLVSGRGPESQVGRSGFKA